MSELALPGDDSRGPSLPDKIRYAEALAKAGLLPGQYREKPANVLFAMEYADALGLPTITAITSVHVIDGKPSASADLIAFLVRRAGHKLRIKGNDTAAEATIIRADDPDFPFTAEWDQAKAERAGLWGKGNWAKYPAAMLKARCITEVARMGANDALFGIVYTPEELGAEVAEDGTPIITSAPAARPHQAQARPLHVVSEQERQATALPVETDEERAFLDNEWLTKADGCTDAEELRALYREARDAGQLQRSIEARGEVLELHEWITARAEKIKDDAKAATAGETPAPEPAPEAAPVEDPLAEAQAAVAAAGLLDADAHPEVQTMAPVEGEVLDAPRPAPVEDPDDLCRNTAQRKAVQNELMAIFGGEAKAVAAIETEFGVPHTKVSTKRLREFMTRKQQGGQG